MNAPSAYLAACGVFGIVTGVALLSVPAAWVVGGLLLLVAAYLNLDVPGADR